MQHPNSAILAGGTGLSLERNDTIETLIDLQDMNLSYITEFENHFELGAMVSSYEIAQDERLPTSLRKAANTVGDTPILHAVTLGGNLAKLYNWVDLPPILWALNATVVLYDPKKKELNFDNFMTYSKEDNMTSRNALLTSVILPKLPENSCSGYQSLVATENSKGQLNLANYFEYNQDHILTDIRLVLSAAVNFPIRLTSIEEKLSNRKLTDLEEIVNDDIIADISVIAKHSHSEQYLKHILLVYLKRSIRGCLNNMEDK